MSQSKQNTLVVVERLTLLKRQLGLEYMMIPIVVMQTGGLQLQYKFWDHRGHVEIPLRAFFLGCLLWQPIKKLYWLEWGVWDGEHQVGVEVVLDKGTFRFVGCISNFSEMKTLTFQFKPRCDRVIGCVVFICQFV